MSLIIATSLAAAAQSGPSQAASGSILIDRTRIDRAAPALPVVEPVTNVPPASITDAPTGAPIRGIRFVGAKAPASVARAAEKFLGKPATRPVLTDLAAKLSTAYGDSPVALYTVAIPDQDFAAGLVIISLTEGRIARAQVRTDRPGSFPLLRRRIAPLTEEASLTRTTFERQLSLMRAIPGLTVATEFTDSDGNGALTLTVAPQQKRTKFTGGYSNRGVSLLGDGQFDARAEAYGLGIDGDQLSLAVSAASDLKRFRYVSAGYAAPIGSNGLTLSGSLSYLETRPAGYPVTGTAKQAGLTLSYPVVRGFRESVDVSLGLDGLDSDNAAFGNLVASERTRAVRAAASFGRATPKRSISLSGSISHGLDQFGARVAAFQADPGFLKLAASAAVAQAIGKRLILRGSASGQYSADPLPAAERFAVGGEAIGRAFDTSLLTGDSGYGGLVEIAVRPIKAAKFQQTEIYTFVDAGRVSIRDRGPAPGGNLSLASAGAGMRLRYREKIEFGVEAARAIEAPYASYGEDWRISVAWRVSI